MATLRDIRTRIKGVKSTQQITKAMKMVAAAKLRRAQDNMYASRPYSHKVKSLLMNLASDESIAGHELIKPRSDIKTVAIVVITADRGLCGAFNTNILKRVTQMINTEYAEYKQSGQLKIIAVGKIGYEFFKKRGFTVDYHSIGLFGHLNLSYARAINQYVTTAYQQGTYDQVIAVYNEFKTVLSPKIVETQLLPISIDHQENKSHKGQVTNYIFEPNRKAIVDGLIPMYLQQQCWQMLLESFASEQGSRMTAMDSATENAKELIRVLTLSYNRLRQAAITKEIAEIVSGAESLK